uniref:SBP-type domain-containing protein n=1 Tax=Kalanchoe fedtschenkoi TaxID=63787 RepID=A0A7N0UU77_KALFE
MEDNVGDQIHQFYGTGSSSLNPMGKRSLEWDLNDWKWDGHLFVASPLNCKPSGYSSRRFLTETGGSSNSSSTCSDDVNMGNDAREQELLKLTSAAGGELGESGNLSLKLGGHGVPTSETEVRNWEGANGKKIRVVGGSSSNRAVCQVEDCGADLSKAKDYHRRHKVCEMHSKASTALVGNVMQRFCQQCSRFHALQEFDEGKRSCRRRLAGHNKRRRKTNPLNVAAGTSNNDDQSNSYLLLTLLKILADLHSNSSDNTKNQDMLSHLLRSLADHTGANGGRNLSEVVSALPATVQQGLLNSREQLTSAVKEMPQNGSPSADVSPPPSTLLLIKDSPPGSSVAPSTTAGQIKPNNFDLNDVYVDSDDGTEDLEGFRVPANNGTSSPGCPSWIQQDVHNSSPPQVSRNSDSGSAQSPSSSNEGDQIRTDRIVFKLFGKEPGDLPVALRTQILDWLAHTPTDIESYIKPGCIVLTIYLRLPESVWDELCLDLSSSLSQLIDVSEESFWSTGWVYVRVQDQVAFIDNGQVVLDTTLPYISSASRILSVRPIAIPISEKASFSIKGCNLFPPNSRLLCALEGQYLAQENIPESQEEFSGHNDSDKLQILNYSCSIPAIIGRGFVEVEDNGLGSDFFPFIVAETDICCEIRTLESTLESTETDETSGNGEPDARTKAIDFIQEMGWLLRRSQQRLQLGYSNQKAEELFHFDRLKWLMEFALDHGWCAVVKKLLDTLCSGAVGSGEHDSLVVAVADMGILHRAVRRNSKPLVELLLRYVHEGTSNNMRMKGGGLLFTPDAMGPAGLTPLHIAAGRDGAEAVIDALTDDPNKVGIVAWKSARDSTGASPEDYARLRGHYSYIHLVQRKTSKKLYTPSHVVLDIPSTLSDSKPNKTETATQKSSFQISKFAMRTGQGPCKICDQKLIYRTVNTSLAYKPAVLSMVAVAAVCVCVALLFKSCPEVLYVLSPFRWENLEYRSS